VHIITCNIYPLSKFCKNSCTNIFQINIILYKKNTNINMCCKLVSHYHKAHLAFVSSTPMKQHHTKKIYPRLTFPTCHIQVIQILNQNFIPNIWHWCLDLLGKMNKYNGEIQMETILSSSNIQLKLRQSPKFANLMQIGYTHCKPTWKFKIGTCAQMGFWKHGSGIQ